MWQCHFCSSGPLALSSADPVLPAEETLQRTYAMKRMRKSAVVQCPEHVFCEQAITRNTAHMFCIRCAAGLPASQGGLLLLHVKNCTD